MDRVSTPGTATSQFIQADDDDDIDESALPAFSHPTMRPSTPPLNKGKSRAPEQLALPTGSAPSQLSGNVGTPIAGAGRGARRNIGGVQVESRSGGIDTLDEPITTTIVRDLRSIYHKLIQVLYPPRRGRNREVLRDWDLWGPLVLCLGLGALLSLNAPAANSISVFTAVIVIVSLGTFVVTVQTKLLGGKISFFQGLCVLGVLYRPSQRRRSRSLVRPEDLYQSTDCFRCLGLVYMGFHEFPLGIKNRAATDFASRLPAAAVLLRPRMDDINSMTILIVFTVSLLYTTDELRTGEQPLCGF